MPPREMQMKYADGFIALNAAASKMPSVSGVLGAVTTTKSHSRQKRVQLIGREHLVDARHGPVRIASQAEHAHVKRLGLERQVRTGVAQPENARPSDRSAPDG